MSPDSMDGGEHSQAPPEQAESLWFLTISPAIWIAHFLASYVTAAIWCAKMADASRALGSARGLMVLYSGLALAGIGTAGWRALRMHRLGGASAPHAFDTPEDRHRFLGFAAFLLSGLSAVAVVYVTIAVALVGTCR